MLAGTATAQWWATQPPGTAQDAVALIVDGATTMPAPSSLGRGGADPAPGPPDPLLLPPTDGFPPAGHGELGEPLGDPPTVPAASAAYAFSRTQTLPDGRTSPITWSPCRPIHFVINDARAPERFAGDVRAAFAELSTVTGLVFVDDGMTTEAPDAQRSMYQPEVYGDRWAPVVVQLADPASVDVLTDTVVGLAVAGSVHDPNAGVAHLVSGAVFLDHELLTMADVGSEPAYLPVLRHELGHLVGLDHVEDPTQLMHPATGGVTTYAEGDLTGLAELGDGPCAPGI